MSKSFKRYLAEGNRLKELDRISSIYETAMSDIREFVVITEAFISPGEIIDIFNIAAKKRGTGTGLLGNLTASNRSATAKANQVKQKIEPVIQDIKDEADSSPISQEVQSDDPAEAEEAMDTLQSSSHASLNDIKTALMGKNGASQVKALADRIFKKVEDPSVAAFVASTLQAASKLAKSGEDPKAIFAMLAAAMEVIVDANVAGESPKVPYAAESVISEGPLDFLSNAWSKVSQALSNTSTAKTASNVKQNVSKSMDIAKGKLGVNGGRGEVSAEVLKTVWKNKYHGSTDSKDIEQILRDFNFSKGEIKSIFKQAGLKDIDNREDYNDNLVKVANLIKRAGIKDAVLSWLKRNQQQLMKMLPESVEHVNEQSELSDKDVLDIINSLVDTNTEESVEEDRDPTPFYESRVGRKKR